MNDNQYICVEKYKNYDHNSNHNQVTDAVFWKFDDKSVCNAKRCSNIRFVMMLYLTLISFCLFWTFVSIRVHVYVYVCFVIGLLESLCVSRLARCFIIIEIFAILTEFYLFAP